MRSHLRLTTLVASLLVTAWAFPGCSSAEEGQPAKTDSGAMPSGRMAGGAMDKDKMGGGAMDKDKMGGSDSPK